MTIYCDPDGHEIGPQPYASPQDELARLQAENAAIKQAAREIMDFCFSASIDGNFWECDICHAKERIEEPNTIQHRESCPVRRLEELK